MCSRDVAKKKISKIEAAKFIFPSRAEQVLGLAYERSLHSREKVSLHRIALRLHCQKVVHASISLGKTDTHTHAHNVDKAGFIVCLLPAS